VTAEQDRPGAVIHVRQAEARDAQRICAIWNHVIETSAVTFTTEAKTEAGIVADIAARGAGFQVAELDGTIVGFATYFQFRGGPGYRHTMEHSIQLAPEARGRGAGRALMAALEAAAQAQAAKMPRGMGGLGGMPGGQLPPGLSGFGKKK